MTSRIALIALATMALALAASGGPTARMLPPTRVAACDSNRFMMTMTRGVLEVVHVYRAATADSTTPPIRSLQGPGTNLCSPTDLAVDSRGRLHVLNRGSITVYHRGTAGDSAPVRSIPATGYGLGLDRRGNIYVAGGDPGLRDSGSISVYAPDAGGGEAPRRTLLGGNSGRHPQGLAVDGGGRIYATVRGDSVFIFGPRANGAFPAVQALAGPMTRLSRPYGLAFDGRGNLYVANNGGNTVTVYAPGSVGNVAPVRTIEPEQARSRLQNPNFLALDPHDTLYVGMPDGVMVYAPDANGKAAPARSIATYRSRGVAVGRDRTLYVLSEPGLVLVFAPGASDTTPPRRTIGGVPGFHTSGVALGPSDRLYLTESGDTADAVYWTGINGALPLTPRLHGANSLLSSPSLIAVTRQGFVYVVNGPRRRVDGAIRVYSAAANGDTLPRSLLMGPATRLSQPGDVDFDSRGDMYVVNRSDVVTIFRPGSNGNARPIRTIAGPNSLLRGPSKLALGPGDTLYVLNAFGETGLGPTWKYGTGNVSVTVYPPGSNGDLEPIRTITVTGGETIRGGRFPSGIAVDTRGSVYLSDYASNFVSVYAPGARGAAVPVRRIRIPPAKDEHGRLWPYMVGAAVAIGPRGELFVAAFPQQMAFTRREGTPDEKGTDPQIALRNAAVRSERVVAMALMLK